MPQVVWVAGREGTVRYFNDRIGSFAGASRSESGEWIWERSHHPDDVLPAQTAWRSAVESGTPYSNEHRIMMADGTYRWHLSRAFPVLSDDGGVERWYGTATDVHDLKLVEHELERRRREFETLVEHSPDIVARFDRDLRFRYINSAVESGGWHPRVSLHRPHDCRTGNAGIHHLGVGATLPRGHCHGFAATL